MTPVPAATATDVIDTTKGTVHMVIGGGGTSVPSNQLFFDPPACRVITAVGALDPATGKRPPIYVKEDAPWSAVRNAAHSYGFAAFDLDPGSRPGDFTTIKVTYYDVVGTDGSLAPFESFTLRRPRRDQLDRRAGFLATSLCTITRIALDNRHRYSYIAVSSLIRDAFARVLSDAERVRCPRAGHTPAPGRLRTPPGR